MNEFPRTDVGGLSLSRLVAGSNWWLGFTHQTRTRSDFVKQYQTRENLAAILDVYLREGVNAMISPLPSDWSPVGEAMVAAMEDARQATGRPLHWIATPSFEVGEAGPDWDAAAREFDRAAELGAAFCWPHTAVTDRLYDGMMRTIRHMERLCAMVRQRGLIGGLSTHLPEVIVAADRTGLDVASYVCIYNSAGFLMPLEIDWTRKIIHEALKPVLTIKPMAAGRVMPYVGLPFVWATLRDCDLVSAGTVTPDEAREVIEISRAAIEGRPERREFQATRSKKSLQ